MQADAVPWSEASVDELDPGTGEPLNQERVLIRRARIRAEATRDHIRGTVELDGNTLSGATARLLAATLSYTFEHDGKPRVTVTGGLFRTPFGMEVQMPERIKPFLEPPSFARALFPGNYDAGAMVNGEYGAARWSFAVINGAPVGDAQWHGKDPLSSFDFVGRLGVAVDGPYRSHFEAGVSAITGRGIHPGTPATKEDVQWIDQNQDGVVQLTELRVVPGSAAAPSQTFERNAIGFDATARWCLCVVGNGVAFAEVVLASNLDRGLIYADPIAMSRDLRGLGFALAVVQDVGKHVQLGVRYDRYDADRDAAEQQGLVLVGTTKVFSTVGVMATARWNDRRLLLQYDHERNPFGRGDNGAPTTLAADRLTLRAQVGF